MSAFPMMVVDLSVVTDWKRGLLRNSPVGDAIIGSPFAATGDNDHHTTDNPHSGQDFPCPTGIAIHDRLGGVVRASGYDYAAGWWVSISYPSGWSSFYCHMMQSTHLNSGTVVPPDGIVGYSGNTGAFTSGEHLHWTLDRPTGLPVDPMLYVGPDGLDFEPAASLPLPATYPVPVVEWVPEGWGAESTVPWEHTYPMRAQTVKAGAYIALVRDGRTADGYEEFHLAVQDYEGE